MATAFQSNAFQDNAHQIVPVWNGELSKKRMYRTREKVSGKKTNSTLVTR